MKDPSLICLLSLGFISLLSLDLHDADANGSVPMQIPPMAVDSEGVELQSAVVGQMVILSTTYSNENCHPCVILMEVRDSKDVTVYLQFQIVTLESNTYTNLGISWIPSEQGKHEIRSFAIKSFTEPLILSELVVSDFTVNLK